MVKVSTQDDQSKNSHDCEGKPARLAKPGADNLKSRFSRTQFSAATPSALHLGPGIALRNQGMRSPAA